MKRLLASVLVAALGSVLGCESKSPPGGPGATRTTDRSGSGTTTIAGRSEDTFKIAVPTLTTGLKQGESKEVTLSIERGANFKQNVQLKFEASKGVRVTPANPTLKASDNELKVMVEAMRDAPLGEGTITVTATPETGTPTSAVFKIDINKGGDSE